MNAAILATHITCGLAVAMYKATQIERLLLDELVAQEGVVCSELAVL